MVFRKIVNYLGEPEKIGSLEKLQKETTLKEKP